ncbi:MAG: hypothetical protein H6Q25_1615 [Bacteroidetes bacterium]|nr:hypothetical protein [Bacteroidota bacterium]
MNISFFTFLFLLSYLNPFQKTILPNDSFQKNDYCGIVFDSIPKDTIPFYYYAVEKNGYSYANVCVKKGYSSLKLTFHDKLPLTHFSPDGLINIKGVNLFVDPLQNDPKKIEFGTYGFPIEARKVYSGRPASASNLNGLYYIPDE